MYLDVDSGFKMGKKKFTILVSMDLLMVQFSLLSILLTSNAWARETSIKGPLLVDFGGICSSLDPELQESSHVDSSFMGTSTSKDYKLTNIR